jgi:hypothetical protein
VQRSTSRGRQSVRPRASKAKTLEQRKVEIEERLGYVRQHKPSKLEEHLRVPYVASFQEASLYMHTYPVLHHVNADNFQGCFHMLGNMRLVMYKGIGDLHIYRLNPLGTLSDIPVRWEHKSAHWVYIPEHTSRAQLTHTSCLYSAALRPCFTSMYSSTIPPSSGPGR